MADKYWNLAEKVAIASEPVARQRLAAVLVHRNNIISVGYNKKKSHPFQRQYAKNEQAIYLHAEIDCLKNALRIYDEDVVANSTMYVLRVKRPEDNPKKFIRGLAKPCVGCQRAIAAFDVKHVCYTTDDGYDSL